MTPSKWMRRADIDDGVKPGTTSQENAELRNARVGRRAHPHVVPAVGHRLAVLWPSPLEAPVTSIEAIVCLRRSAGRRTGTTSPASAHR